MYTNNQAKRLLVGQVSKESYLKIRNKADKEQRKLADVVGELIEKAAEELPGLGLVDRMGDE